VTARSATTSPATDDGPAKDDVEACFTRGFREVIDAGAQARGLAAGKLANTMYQDGYKATYPTGYARGTPTGAHDGRGDGYDDGYAAGFADGTQRRHVDAVLSLVVGGAAPVPAFALGHQGPRRKPFAPMGVLPADDVAMAVAQDRREGRVFDAARDEERAAGRHRIGDLLANEAQRLERGRELFAQVGAERGRGCAGVAFGAERDAAFQIGKEATVVEGRDGSGEGVGTGHRAFPCGLGTACKLKA
jgi:hypothetical protein